MLAVPGWWRRPSRFHYPPLDRWGTDVTVPNEPELPEDATGILVVGPTTPLSDAFIATSAVRAIPCTRIDVLATSEWTADTLEAIVSKRHWAVILTTTPTHVPPEDAASVARACADAGIPLLFCSPDPAAPFEDRGQAALTVEQAILKAHPKALVVWSEPFPGLVTIDATMSGLEEREPQKDSAIYVDELVEASMDLLIDGERGVWHPANRGPKTWDCVAPVDLAVAVPGG